jgi:AraC-like DNA-binding protein
MGAAVEFGQVCSVPFVSGVHAWDHARRPAHPRLQSYVAGYSGYDMVPAGPVVCRMLPTTLLTVAVDFVAPRQQLAGDTERALPHMAPLLTGLQGSATVLGHTGRRHGVAIGLTPRGAFALCGVPMRELTGQTVNLNELLGARADELAERLAYAPGWPARFDLLDALLTTWIATGPATVDAVQLAWRQLASTDGQTRISHVAEELGLSRRRLEMRFAEQVGITPKRLARVLRFQHALRLICTAKPPALSQIAIRCGYADQSHLAREIRSLAGCTPTDLLHQRPTLAGLDLAER